MKSKLDISKIYSINFDYTIVRAVGDIIFDYAYESFERPPLAERTKRVYTEKALLIYQQLMNDNFANVKRAYFMNYDNNPNPYVCLILIALLQIAETIDPNCDTGDSMEFFGKFLLTEKNAVLADITMHYDTLFDMPKGRPETSFVKEYLHDVREVLEMYEEWGDEQVKRSNSILEDCKSLRSDNTQLMQEKESLEHKCNELKQRCSVIESKYHTALKECESLRNQIEIYKSTIKSNHEAGDLFYNKNVNAALREVDELKARLHKEAEEHNKTKTKLKEANNKLSNNKKEEIEQQVKLQEIERMVEKAKRLHSWEEAKPIYDFLINTYRGCGEEVFDIIDKIDEHFNKKESTTKIISKKTNIKLQGDANFHSQANIDTFIDNNGTVNNKK